MRKRIIVLALFLAALLQLAAGVSVASTSWVAGFMDLAGIDDVITIAPPSLRHPPEYELTPSDVVTVMNAELFCYAGYERMMKTISSSLRQDGSSMKVTTGNNLQNVLAMTAAIAEAAGTEARTEEYEKAIMDGRALVEACGLSGLRVYVNTNQTPLAEDLGLSIAGVFGAGALTAAQLDDLSSGSYDLIIDNVHNPVAGPAAEVTDAPVVIWRNFPETTGRGALTDVVKANIEALREALMLD